MNFIMYIVYYHDQSRTEGGPIATRHFDTYDAALKFAERVQKDPDCSQLEIWKQHTHITRERIH